MIIQNKLLLLFTKAALILTGLQIDERLSLPESTYTHTTDISHLFYIFIIFQYVQYYAVGKKISEKYLVRVSREIGKSLRYCLVKILHPPR